VQPDPEPSISGWPVIDDVPLWLLRVGIDHSGQLAFNQVWDVAVRAAVVAQLRIGGRLSDVGASVEVDTEDSGISYEDAACQQLLARAKSTEASWIRAGRLRAADVAAFLVESGEWSRHVSPFSPGLHKYRAAKQQYVALRRHLAHAYDGSHTPRSDAEAAVVVLGHAVNAIRPKRLDLHSTSDEDPLQPYECGALADAVETAIAEINSLAAAGRANVNPTW